MHCCVWTEDSRKLVLCLGVLCDFNIKYITFVEKSFYRVGASVSLCVWSTDYPMSKDFNPIFSPTLC